MKVQWDEPVDFVRDYQRSRGDEPTRRGRALTAVITAVVVDGLVVGFDWFFYLLHKKDLGVPAYTYVVAPVLAGVFVYFLPTMATGARCTIVLTENGIHRNKALGTILSLQLWPWDSISELAVEEFRHGDVAHRVLVVRSSLEPGDVLLGIGDTPFERIAQAVAQMGKKLINGIT